MLSPDALKALLDAGPYGLAVVAFLVAGWAVKQWMAEARGRLDDQKEMGKQLASVQSVIQEMTRSNEARSDAFEESVRLQALTGVGVASNGTALVEIKDGLAKLVQQIASTREKLVRNGNLDP